MLLSGFCGLLISLYSLYLKTLFLGLSVSNSFYIFENGIKGICINMILGFSDLETNLIE